MKKDTLKILKGKNATNANEKNQDLAKFLKRRRLEKKKTLEEVSQGICSPSYLSKIENSQVVVDDFYYKILFEKLDLQYDKVQKTRITPIYPELFKLYLLDKLSEIEEKVNAIIQGNSYCDTEIELIVLFNSVINGTFSEASYMINRLEEIHNSLTDDELETLFFINALYAYKTNDYHKAEELIVNLLNLVKENEVLEAVCLDLAIDIFSITNKKALFFLKLNQLSQNAFCALIPKRMLKHRLQSLVLMSKERYDGILEELQFIKSLIGSEDELENYYFCLGQMYYEKGEFSEVCKLLEENLISKRIIALYGLAIVLSDDYHRGIAYVKMIKSLKTNDNERVFMTIIEYVRQRIEQYNYVKVYTYIKTTILSVQQENNFAFFYHAIVNEYIQLAIFLGKYKETLRHINKLNLINCKL